MKTKYLLLLSIPYVIAYFILFMSVSAQSNKIEGNNTNEITVANQIIQIQHLPDPPVLVMDSIAYIYRKQ